MKVKQLATYLTKLEGKKSQVKIGDAREIVSLLSDLIQRDFKRGGKNKFHTYHSLRKNGVSRARRVLARKRNKRSRK